MHFPVANLSSARTTSRHGPPVRASASATLFLGRIFVKGFRAHATGVPVLEANAEQFFQSAKIFFRVLHQAICKYLIFLMKIFACEISKVLKAASILHLRPVKGVFSTRLSTGDVDKAEKPFKSTLLEHVDKVGSAAWL
jgi:hypothetical protein